MAGHGLLRKWAGGRRRSNHPRRGRRWAVESLEGRIVLSTLQFPSTLSGKAGETLVVPLTIDNAGGLEAADIAISYDTTRLDVASMNDVRLGTLTSDFDTFLVNLDPAAGTIQVGMGRLLGPISTQAPGSLLEITFHIRPLAQSGDAIINLREHIGLTFTTLNEDGIPLNPAPSDQAGDALDGKIAVEAVPGKVLIAPTAGLTTSETGGQATFDVVLDTPPIADVVLGLSSSDPTEGTVLPTSLTFTSANWNVPQTVHITGVDDPVKDGNINYTIMTGPITSADNRYDGVNGPDVPVVNIDDENQAPISAL